MAWFTRWRMLIRAEIAPLSLARVHGTPFFISDLKTRRYSYCGMPAALFSLILTVGLAVRCLAQAPVELQRKFDEAARHIVRLSPADFKELPSNLVRELERRSCAIPQDYTNVRGNVIRGDFKKLPHPMSARAVDRQIPTRSEGISLLLFLRHSEQARNLLFLFGPHSPRDRTLENFQLLVLVKK